MAADLGVVVVSHDDARWLPACLGSLLERAGGLGLDVVVVENGTAAEASRSLVERDFPSVRHVTTENRGFPHATNLGLRELDARHLLLLNPDTEILDGDLAALVAWMDERPEVGVAGVRQLDGDGRLLFTIRRFPSPLRALGEALGAERLPAGRRLLCERELDPAAYEREAPCDWSVGSFLLVRREAIDAAGPLDERLFLYSDEPDLCLRIRAAGWATWHVPLVTIAHHVRPERGSPRNEAQSALSRRVYARKHFGPARRAAFMAALLLRHLLRAVAPGSAPRRAAARAALAALSGRAEPPFGPPPGAAPPPRGPQSGAA